MLIILLIVLLLYNANVYAQTQYIYGNEIKTIKNSELDLEQIDLMIYQISEIVKTYDELKYNYTQLQLYDNGVDVLNTNLFRDLIYVENLVENKKMLISQHEKNIFNHIINTANVINMFTINVQSKYNDNLIKPNVNLTFYFEYLDYEDIVLDSSITIDDIKDFKLKIYFTKSNINYLLNKKNMILEEIKKYNPDIHNNFIRSINNLYYSKRQIKQKN
jgi:hypothetical protein